MTLIKMGECASLVDKRLVGPTVNKCGIIGLDLTLDASLRWQLSGPRRAKDVIVIRVTIVVISGSRRMLYPPRWERIIHAIFPNGASWWQYIANPSRS